jgi:hypothetical protein
MGALKRITREICRSDQQFSRTRLLMRLDMGALEQPYRIGYVIFEGSRTIISRWL